MRIRLSFAAFAFSALIVTGLPGVYADQDRPAGGWSNRVVGSLSLTQARFDNWAQGGESTLGWQAAVNGKFINSGVRHEWANAVNLAYGMTKVGDDDASKSVDEIKIESVFTYKAGFYVDPYVATTAETQFSKGYEYTGSGRSAISDFLDPGYFTQSAGIGRVYKDVFRTRLGASIKEKTKVEVGAESVTDLNLTLGDDLTFDSKLELFSNLKASNEIDINWDNLLTAKVEKYISVTLNVRVFYDRDISKSRQIKEALALGLTYTFM
jgi:hypothetical protein